MKIYQIAALSTNHVIAHGGKIPWKIKGDLPRFKEITMGHPIIMGRKTLKSMGGKPLPGRKNIVLTRQAFGEVAGNLHYVNSVEEALQACGDANEVYVIGGGEIYQEFMPLTDELRLTIVHQTCPEDETSVYFPEVSMEWVKAWEESHDTHTYMDFVRPLFES